MDTVKIKVQGQEYSNSFLSLRFLWVTPYIPSVAESGLETNCSQLATNYK